MAPHLLANQGGQIRQAMAIKCLALPRGILPRRSDTALVAFVAARLFLVAGPVTASVPPPFSTFFQENVRCKESATTQPGTSSYWGTNDSPIPGHESDLVVARFDASATKVVYFVYLGGSGDDDRPGTGRRRARQRLHHRLYRFERFSRHFRL